MKEAQKLNIPIFAICDTNSDPELVDFPIPANDDASKSVALIVGVIGKAIEDGLSERKVDKEEAERKESDEAAIAEKTGCRRRISVFLPRRREHAKHSAPVFPFSVLVVIRRNTRQVVLIK